MSLRYGTNSTGTETTASTQNVTVNLGATYQTVEVFDPLSGTAPVQTLSNVSSVSLGLTDHPLIIETEPQSTTTPVIRPVTTPPGSRVTTPPVTTPPGTTGGGGSSPDTLTLNVSGDHWKSDAQFIVKVNGQQAGGTYDASALHSSGDAGTVQLTGNWGSGVQNVQVSFINDAYGGSASTDRNLYVNSIAYDGTTYANTSATMMSNGTDTFAVGGSTPTAAAPADTLTLTLSEDAYKGNADFKLIIDGKAVTAPQVVSALKDAGSTQSFTFTGNLGAGTHTIGIGFINDA